jgi:hypothetical protein
MNQQLKKKITLKKAIKRNKGKETNSSLAFTLLQLWPDLCALLGTLK